MLCLFIVGNHLQALFLFTFYKDYYYIFKKIRNKNRNEFRTVPKEGQVLSLKIKHQLDEYAAKSRAQYRKQKSAQWQRNGSQEEGCSST